MHLYGMGSAPTRTLAEVQGVLDGYSFEAAKHAYYEHEVEYEFALEVLLWAAPSYRAFCIPCAPLLGRLRAHGMERDSPVYSMACNAFRRKLLTSSSAPPPARTLTMSSWILSGTLPSNPLLTSPSLWHRLLLSMSGLTRASNICATFHGTPTAFPPRWTYPVRPESTYVSAHRGMGMAPTPPSSLLPLSPALLLVALLLMAHSSPPVPTIMGPPVFLHSVLASLLLAPSPVCRPLHPGAYLPHCLPPTAHAPPPAPRTHSSHGTWLLLQPVAWMLRTKWGFTLTP